MDTKEETAVLDPEQLEKSFDESITALRTLLGGGDDDKATNLEKAKKQPPEDEESGDEEEDETDEEEKEEGPYMKKSLPDMVAEENEEAAAAMDVEPFLKALTNGIQKYLDQSFENLHKSLVGKINAVGELTKSMGKIALGTAEMQKSIRDVVYKIGKTPIPTGTVLRKSGDRFEAGKEEVATDGQRTRAEQVKVLQKSHELLQKGQIDIIMATKIEGRVTKNLPLPPEVAELFAEGGKQ
jgi:hypothetical protein